ncbi:MAG: master DNA invertase Mpi family serine-type recombinase [Bacteroidota bacterium]
MIYAYIRVSTDRQTVENQRYEILKFASDKKLSIDEWVEETVTGTKSTSERRLGSLLQQLKAGDSLLVGELSRLGRNLMEVMSILHDCMEREAKVFAIKEGYELGNNINSQFIAFAFSLSAEIERNLISQRTMEALARRKSEGMKLGRPKGSLAKLTKLTGKEAIIQELLAKRISISSIGRILGVNRLTVESFIRTRQLRK